MVTIKDVAREAGVSAATVSRVWNDSELVGAETRARVAAVAARLGYSPNSAARSLRTRGTRTIGVLLPDLHGEFFSEVTRGIDQSARRRGFHLLVSSSHSDRQEANAALRSMRGRVDGLIVMSPDPDVQLAIGRIPATFPVVLLNCAAGVTRDSLTIANYEGARAMVRHLVGLGHRRIATIAGPERNHDADERLRGYRDALREAGVEPEPALEVRGDFREGSGYEGTTQLLQRAVRPTAIFAANDCMAIGAMSALGDHGFDVPADVAVAGFDDIPMARFVSPALSSVHVHIAELGERATQRLLDAIGNGRTGEAVHEILPTQLVLRRSCGGQAAGGMPSSGPVAAGRVAAPAPSSFDPASLRVPPSDDATGDLPFQPRSQGSES
jgi:LacI family transcriptional regulator